MRQGRGRAAGLSPSCLGFSEKHSKAGITWRHLTPRSGGRCWLLVGIPAGTVVRTPVWPPTCPEPRLHMAGSVFSCKGWGRTRGRQEEACDPASAATGRHCCPALLVIKSLGRTQSHGEGHTPTSRWGDQQRVCRQSLSRHGAPSPDSGVTDVSMRKTGHLNFVLSCGSEGFTLGLFSLPGRLG